MGNTGDGSYVRMTTTIQGSVQYHLRRLTLQPSPGLSLFLAKASTNIWRRVYTEDKDTTYLRQHFPLRTAADLVAAVPA